LKCEEKIKWSEEVINEQVLEHIREERCINRIRYREVKEEAKD
jgi:hypothetical protein